MGRFIPKDGEDRAPVEHLFAHEQLVLKLNANREEARLVFIRE